MYHNNLKKLRNEYEITQKEISEIIGCNRNTYNNWEQEVIMLPIDIADKLSCFYKVRLSYIYGIDKEYKKINNIKPYNYDKLIENLWELKSKNKHTYKYIAKYIDCTESTVQRYFNKVFVPPIDRLILITKLYNIDLDVLCGKE